MPPIPQQQTSRAGLITSLVIAILFAVGFLVGLVMTNAELNKRDGELKAQLAKYREVIDPNNVSNVSTYKQDFSVDPSGPPRGGTVVDAAKEQASALKKLITGKPDVTEKQVNDEVAAAFKAVKDNADLKGVTIPDTSLTAAILELSKTASASAAAVKQAKDETKAATDALAAANEAHKGELAKRDQAVTDAQASAKKAIDDAMAAIAEKQKQVDDFAAKVAAVEKAMGDLTASEAVKAQTLTAQLEASKKETDKWKLRMAQFRPDVKESVIRNVDATVTQVAPDNICYINLGYGDHVVTGMTFELYDKLDGVPRLTSNTDALNMPKGKASIEIINIGQSSCQCRVIRTSPGQTVSQGDLAVNLVYDKNIKPVFHVYGKYDMDGNGVATDGEAEIIKNLIVRWGGRVSDKVDVDTDFVVMGKEPVVPLFTPEELQNPITKGKKDEADAALKAYNDVRDSAVSIHVPVLNQNRFLYYTGYFDSSRK